MSSYAWSLTFGGIFFIGLPLLGCLFTLMDIIIRLAAFHLFHCVLPLPWEKEEYDPKRAHEYDLPHAKVYQLLLYILAPPLGYFIFSEFHIGDPILAAIEILTISIMIDRAYILKAKIAKWGVGVYEWEEVFILLLLALPTSLHILIALWVSHIISFINFMAGILFTSSTSMVGLYALHHRVYRWYYRRLGYIPEGVKAHITILNRRDETIP